MRTIFSLLTSILLVGVCMQSHAQGLRVISKAKKAKPIQTVKLPRYNGNLGSVMGVDYYLTRAAMQAQTVPQISAEGAAATVALPSRRSWIEQTTRDLKAWNLKRQRRKRDIQNAQLEQQRQQLEALEKTLPPLNPTRTFETDTFEHLLVTHLPQEPLPLLERPGVLYRGMALGTDGDAVKNILLNGLRLEDLGNHATTKLLAMSGGLRGTVSTARPITNLTSLPQDALYWATQRTTDSKELIVIAVVQGQTQSGEIVLYSDDIPAENIPYLLIPLQLGSKPLWYRVELTENSPYSTFRLTPYENLPDAQ